MFLKNETTGIMIGVADMPERKKPCLVVKDGVTMTKYASFNNDFAADKFMEILSEFVGAK